MADCDRFRVWDKEMKQYADDSMLFIDSNGQLHLVCDDGTGQLLDPARYQVERCTGLKDKHGSRIFDGDSVRHKRDITFPTNYYTGEPEDNDVTVIKSGRISTTKTKGVMIRGKLEVYDTEEDEKIREIEKWSGQAFMFDEFAEVVGTIHDEEG